MIVPPTQTLGSIILKELSDEHAQREHRADWHLCRYSFSFLVADAVRKSTDAAAAQAVFGLNDAVFDSLLLTATDDALAEPLLLPEEDLNSLGEGQHYRYYNRVLALLNVYEFG